MPPTADIPSAPAADGPVRLPKQIGDYSIQSVIASGGMGTVYLALQGHPRRRVALKVMNRGIASRSALRRFEYESQILARLRHPNIAQVYESGTHDDGLPARSVDGEEGRRRGVPYFAMEYIPNARTITDYARSTRLGTRRRLDLFAKVCDAVHHGHQKGIIHRDLKPSNVIVDSAGNPKIIDFGVARSTDSDMALTTLQTSIGQLIGTVQYMSPEQCEADPEDLDIRSDVYALGVVLYELLTDRLPYDLSHATMLEAAGVIKDKMPSRPSSLDRTLRGDVETITMKALEKERQRRYQSAAQLGQDIARYLRNEPIEARPPSLAYQVRMFGRRHRAAVIAVAVVLIVSVVAAIVSTAMALSEARQRALAEQREEEATSARMLAEERRKEAEAAGEAEARARVIAQTRTGELELVAEFQASQLSGIDVEGMGAGLREDLLAEARTTMGRLQLGEGELAARSRQLDELLGDMNLTNVALRALQRNIFDRALAAVDEQFDDQPLVRALLLHTLAQTMHDLGLGDRAIPSLAEALEIRRRMLGDQDPGTLRSIDAMGLLLRDQGRSHEAETYLREALETRLLVLGDEHEETLTSIRNMGLLFRDQGKLEEAERLLREALEMRRRVLGDEHPDTLDSIGSMGSLLKDQGRLAEAEGYFREAVAHMRRVRGDEHQETLTQVNNLALLLLEQGKLSEAMPHLHEALQGMRRVLGDEHHHTLVLIVNMGALLQKQGRLAEAEPYFREALTGARRVLGDEHPHTLASIAGMGALLQQQGRLAEAEPYFREALAGARRVLGNEHPNTLSSIAVMGALLHEQGELAKAAPFYRESLQGRRRVLGDEHPRTLRSIDTWGVLLRDQGKLDEAEACIREALETRRRVLGDEHPETLASIVHMGSLHLAQGRLAEAETSFREALAINERLGRREAMADDCANLGDVSNARGDLDGAREMWARSIELYAGLGAQHKVDEVRGRVDDLPE